MSYNPLIHHRNSIRLKGYDYASPGAYFVTIVTHHPPLRGSCCHQNLDGNMNREGRRAWLFGEIVDGEMRLNDIGEIARDEWLVTPAIRPEIALDEFVIMPNHVHAIITIMDNDNGFVGAQRRCAPTHTPKTNVQPGSIGAVIRAYKSAVTTRINQSRGTPGAPVWQRNYWEHIVRDAVELSRIRQYIHNNPVQWEMDIKNRLLKK